MAGHGGRRKLPVVFWVSLASGAWLLGTRTVHNTVLDWGGELVSILFLLLVFPVFAATFLWSLVYLPLGGAPGNPRAVLPLLVHGASLLGFLFLPLGPLVDEVEFRVHHPARSQLAALADAGALRPLSPNGELVPLPREYPRSVSDGAGQQLLHLSREDGATQVVFYPPTGWGNGPSWIVYRSDDQPPPLPDTRRVERMQDHWYRLRPAG